MFYPWAEQKWASGPSFSSLCFKVPTTQSLQGYENLTVRNKLSGAKEDSLEVFNYRRAVSDISCFYLFCSHTPSSDNRGLPIHPWANPSPLPCASGEPDPTCWIEVSTWPRLDQSEMATMPGSETALWLRLVHSEWRAQHWLELLGGENHSCLRSLREEDVNP